MTLKLFREKTFVQIFLSESTSVKIILTKKRAAAKTRLSQSVLITTKYVLLFTVFTT